MASRMNMLRNFFTRVVQSTIKPCTALSLLVVSACPAESGPNSKHPKQFKLLDRKEMTHQALIKQACTLSANSSIQLLTQVLVAISDTSQGYRESISQLTVLMGEREVLLTNTTSSSLDEVEDLIVQQRSIVEEQQKLLLELVSFMDYVEKMVTSTAETAYLAGAEHSSTLICEQLNSVISKVSEERAANKKSEEDLLRLQEIYVVKLNQLYEEVMEDKRNDKNDTKDIVAENSPSQLMPLDIFENSPFNEDLGEDEPNPSL